MTQHHEPSSTSELQQLRVSIASIIQRWFTPLFVLTAFAAIVLIVLTTTGVFTGKTTETMALAASIQVAFGMIIGYVCVYIGLMMTWYGIDAAYDVTGKLGSGELGLKSASPGLLFALGGLVLIGVSLYKPIVYQEGGTFPADVRPYQPGEQQVGRVSGPEPDPLPPFR